MRGIIPALVTPFDESGNLNTKVIEKLVEKHLKEGVSGFYAGGSTGESYLLTEEERKTMLKAVVEAVDGRADIIANIGVFSTRDALRLAEHAEKLGVTAISSVPPFYFPFQIQEYFRYYNDIADAVSVPVVVYNVPALSGVRFSSEELDRLLENRQIAGVKFTCYDLFQYQRLVQDHPDKNIFIGHDEIFLPAMISGADAGIGSTFNFMAEKFVRIMELFEKGSLTEAQKLQNEANEVIGVLCEIGVFKGVKAALKLQGIDCGECRRPFLPLSEGQENKLRMALEKNHVI